MARRAGLLVAALLMSAACLASEGGVDTSNEGFAFGTPLWVLGFAAVILFTFLLIPITIALSRFGVKPVADAEGIEIYSIPGWSMRSISADAMIVFADETGWLGHGMSKYVKDKGDYKLDDVIRAAAPFEPGTARAFAVRRLPVDYLVVANIYDERKVTSSEQITRGFRAAVDEAAKLGCNSAMIFDPTDAWNYFTKRADAIQASKMLVTAISEGSGAISDVKVIVTNPENVEAYKQAIG